MNFRYLARMFTWCTSVWSRSPRFASSATMVWTCVRKALGDWAAAGLVADVGRALTDFEDLLKDLRLVLIALLHRKFPHCIWKVHGRGHHVYSCRLRGWSEQPLLEARCRGL